MNNPVSRRQFVHTVGTTLPIAVFGRAFSADAESKYPPRRAITRGPKHHWFGYYDKLQFDPTSRYVLGMEVDFEHRSPRPDDRIRVGVVDLEDGDSWRELGNTLAWNWQQGCMLQWLPGSPSTVLWNDRDGDRFICRLLDVESGESRVVPHAIYSVSPDGKSAVAPDFRRIADVRPGYGYAGPPDRNADQLRPEESGIFHVDLESGESKLIVSIAEVAAMGVLPEEMPGSKHYFNHLLFSPDGSRFIALHRWVAPSGKRLTRMITANADGSDIRVVIPNGWVSHFIWRDPEHILANAKDWLGQKNWSNFLFKDEPNGVQREIGRGVLNGSGHVTYLPDTEWVLNDTYPSKPDRFQTPHLYHVPTEHRYDLGQFHSPPKYTGEWRVDTHPRSSPDGCLVCIDTPIEGQGRQMMLIDISGIVG